MDFFVPNARPPEYLGIRVLGTGFQIPIHTLKFKCVRSVTIEIVTWTAAVDPPVVLSARGTDGQTLQKPPTVERIDSS